MKNVTRVAALALMAAALVACGPQADAGPTEPTRVLLLGDSITQGRVGDVTWRYHLWNAFRSNVDLVGPKQGQFDDNGGVEVEGQYPYAFDYDHASRWGLSLSFPEWPIGTLIEGFHPDVIVNQLGVNDLVHMTDPAGLVAGQRAFVEAAREADPSVDIVLGELAVAGWHEESADYNALLPALVEELDTAESRVVLASMPAMTREVDSADGLHPSAAGEVKIAAGYAAALDALGVERWSEPVPEPTPPPVVEPSPVVRPPASPGRVQAVQVGARVKVSWRAASGASSYVARCGKVGKQTAGTQVRLKAPSDRCRVRAVNTAGASPWVVAK